MQFQLNKLMLAAGVLVIAGVITPLFILQPWRQPSPEMSLLRKLEVHLNVPASHQRREDDRGQYKHDNQMHNVRRITDFYDTAEPVRRIQATLQPKGYGIKETAKADGKTIVVLANAYDRTCIELRMSSLPNEQDEDGPTNRIVLMSQSDDACSGYLDR